MRRMKIFAIIAALIVLTMVFIPLQKASSAPWFPNFETPEEITSVSGWVAVGSPHLGLAERPWGKIILTYCGVVFIIPYGRFLRLTDGQWGDAAWLPYASSTFTIGELAFATFNGNIYVAFLGMNSSVSPPQLDVYRACFYPENLSWSEMEPVTNDAASETTVFIGVDHYLNRLYIAWATEDSGGAYSIRYTWFDGTSWHGPFWHAKASTPGVDERDPTMVQYGKRQFWAWTENGEIHFCYLDDDTLTWSSEATATGSGYSSPSLAAYAGTVYLAFDGDVDGTDDLYYRTKPANAAPNVWNIPVTKITSLSTGTIDEMDPSIITLGNRMYIAYNSDDTNDIIYFSYADLPPFIQGYPYMFMDPTTISTSYVVGDTVNHGAYGWGAQTVDVLGGMGVSETIGRYASGGYTAQHLDTEIATYNAGTDTVTIDWSKVYSDRLISIGGPGVNMVTYKYDKQLPFHLAWVGGQPVIHSDSTGTDYSDTATEYYFVIATIRDGDRIVMLVWGLTGFGSRDACKMLQIFDQTIFPSLTDLGKAAIMHYEPTHWVGGIPILAHYEIDEVWWG